MRARTASIAGALAMLAATTGAAAPAIAQPAASSSINGGCMYTGGIGSHDLSWSQSDPAGGPVSFNYNEVLYRPASSLVPPAVFASGAQRRGALRWNVVKREGAQTLASCWAHDHTFSNTFTVQAAAGSGLAPGDPVTLVFRPSVYGQMGAAKELVTMTQGGRWVSSAETEMYVSVSEVGGEDLAEFSADGYATARGEDRDVFPAYPNGFLADWWDSSWYTWSNSAGSDGGDVSDSRFLCDAWSVESGCSPGGPNAFHTVSLSPVVPFQTKVGARVAVTGFIDFFSEIQQQSKGGAGLDKDLAGLQSWGDFLTGGLRFSVTDTTPGTDDVSIVWDVSATPPPVPAFVDDFADGAAPADWRVVSGSWSDSRGTYGSASTTKSNRATIVPLEPAASPVGAGAVQAKIKLTSSSGRGGPNGMILFAYQDAANYRYVKVTPTALQIGQAGVVGGVGGGVKKKLLKSQPLNRFALYTVKILPDGWVHVHKGTATKPALSYQFLAPAAPPAPSVVPGGVGLAAAKAETLFDDVVVWRDGAP